MGNDSVQIQDQDATSASNADVDGMQNVKAVNGASAHTAAPETPAPSLTEQDAGAPLTTGNADSNAQATQSAEPSATQASTGTSPSNAQDTGAQSDASQDSSGNQPDNTSPELPSLDCRFCGLDGEPISGAQYRFVIDGNEMSGTTDGSGNAQTLRNIQPESDCTVFIRRDDGTFKQIATFVVPSTNGYVTLMSPSALLEGQSELHAGSQEDVYKEPDAGSTKASTDPASSNGDSSNQSSAGAGNTKPVAADTNVPPGNPSANTAAAQSSQPKPAQKTPVSHASAAASADKPKHPAVSMAQKGGTGKAPQTKAMQTKRDQLSHPQAKPSHDSTDWLDQKVMATWHYLENLFGVKANPVMAASRSAAPAASAKPVAATPSEGPYTALIHIAEEQAGYVLPSKRTIDNISELAKGTFKYGKTKPVSQSTSACYLYVKVALWRAKYVDSALGGTFAKVAGPYLEAVGFKNVTGEIPDGRWALPGDIIVYKLSGDENPTVDNKMPAGHIDIRTYHHYISDFRRNHLFFHGHGTHYEVTGIYRKPGCSDPSVTARVKAFLKVIRSRECSTLYDAYGDQATYRGKYGAVKLDECFSDFSTHPYVNQSAKHTTAGAYQIPLFVWTDGWKNNGLPKDFSPATQDRYAVWLMDTRWESMSDQSSQTALGYVRLGDLDSAVRLLKGTWTSLPGASQDRKYTMDQLRADFNKFLKEYSA